MDSYGFADGPLGLRRTGPQSIDGRTMSSSLERGRSSTSPWLRKDLAKREMEDFATKRVLTDAQFRQRAAQILKSYGEVKPGEEFSPLAKLVRGMPKRLARAKANHYGRCGK